MSSREGSFNFIPLILPDAGHRHVCSSPPTAPGCCRTSWTRRTALGRCRTSGCCRPAGRMRSKPCKSGWAWWLQCFAPWTSRTLTREALPVCTCWKTTAPHWAPPKGGCWMGQEALGSLSFQRPIEGAALASWFAEAGDLGPGEPLVPWWRPGWIPEAVAWTKVELCHREITPSDPRSRCKVGTDPVSSA